MDPRLLAIAPFVYFGKRFRGLTKARYLDGPAQRSAYNFWRVLDGTALLHRPQGEQTLRPDQVAITGPGTPVSLAAKSTVHHLAFDVVYRPRYTKQHGCVIDVRMPPQPGWEELFGHPLPTAPPAAWCQAARLFIDLAEERYWRSATAHLRVNADLHPLLARLLDWQLGDTPIDEGGLVRRAEQLIQQSATAGITVADLAAHMQVSRSLLSERFTHLRGYGPGKALLRRRLECACYLLEADPDRSVEVVAQDCGFASGSVMRRAFAREFGQPPSVWRRSFPS